MAAMTVDVNWALVNEGLDYFERAGDDGDKLYVAEIRQALATLRDAAKDAERVREAGNGLVEKWRSEAKELRARADRYSNGEYYAELHSKADALEDRSDELDAAMGVQP